MPRELLLLLKYAEGVVVVVVEVCRGSDSGHGSIVDGK